MRPTTSDCPCGSKLAYEDCCAPYHRGEREAPTAMALMCSRYSAFVRGDEQYLLRTLHPDHADWEAGEQSLRRSLKETFHRSRYGGLAVLDQRPPGSDGLAEVLFHARVREGSRDRSFVERSYFAHDGVGWRYLAGDLLPAAALKGPIAKLTLEAFEKQLEASR